MTLAPPRPLVEGPSAWIGRDLRAREDEWIYPLSAAEIAEIDSATAAVRAPRPRHRRHPPRRLSRCRRSGRGSTACARKSSTGAALC